MAVDPIGKTLFDVYGAMADRKQAELDLERARTKEAIVGRSAVPGVMAELAKRKEQEDKKRQKIAEQGQQQAPAQSMAPPLTEVNGRMTGRSPGAALTNARKLADFISGGGGIKGQGGGLIPGGPKNAGLQQVSIPRAGVSAGLPGPAAAGQVATAPAGAAGAAQAQQAPTTPAASAASIEPIPIQRDVGGVERGVDTAIGLLTRDPGSLRRAATGKETIGWTTVQEQAQQFVPGLAVLEARRRSTDPAVSEPARQMYEQKIEELRKINPVLADEAARQGLDTYYLADERQRLIEEDPKWKADREKATRAWAIEEKVIENGTGALTPGELEWWNRNRRKTDVTVNVDTLEKAARVQLQQDLEKGRVAVQHLDSIEQALGPLEKNAWIFTWEGRADVGRLRLKAESPLLWGAITPEEREKIEAYTAVEQSIAAFDVPAMHDLIGATMSPPEIQRINPLFPGMHKDFYTNRQDLLQLREDYGLSLFRKEFVLEKNSAIDPRFAFSLGHSRQLVEASATERIDYWIKEGATEAEALDRTRHEFRSRYGLNIDRIMGAQ